MTKLEAQVDNEWQIQLLEKYFTSGRNFELQEECPAIALQPFIPAEENEIEKSGEKVLKY